MDDDDLRLWRDLQLVHLQVTHRLHRGLVADVGLAYRDYVVLSEVVDGPMRFTELARRVGSEKSRLSHQVDRLEGAGLVVRRPSADDRRGAEVAITAAGRRLQRRATPGHVGRIAALFGSQLTAPERRALRAAATRILDALA